MVGISSSLNDWMCWALVDTWPISLEYVAQRYRDWTVVLSTILTLAFKSFSPLA
jgi:hypothetical protein